MNISALGCSYDKAHFYRFIRLQDILEKTYRENGGRINAN